MAASILSLFGAARPDQTFTPSREVGLPTLTRQLLSLLQERREAARARARMRLEPGPAHDTTS